MHGVSHGGSTSCGMALQTRQPWALQERAAHVCHDQHRNRVPRVYPVVRPQLLGTTGQDRRASNEIGMDSQREEQHAYGVQSWYVVASERVSSAAALYRALPLLSTANRGGVTPPRCQDRLMRWPDHTALWEPCGQQRQWCDAVRGEDRVSQSRSLHDNRGTWLDEWQVSPGAYDRHAVVPHGRCQTSERGYR
jgi:hypothetical protein